MKQFFVLIIIFLLSANMAAAASFSPNDVEWASPAESTLSRGGTMVSGEFMVKAVQFPSPVPGYKNIKGTVVPETPVDPMVFLEIYKNGALIKELVMTPISDPYIDPDYEVKVSATGFMDKNATEWIYEYYKPWAKIAISLRGKPKLEVSVTSDKAEFTYYKDQITTCKIEVKNSGDAKARNVDVNFNPGELKLRGGDIGQLHQYFYELKKGESKSYEVILLIPEVLDKRSFKITTDAKGFDIKNLEFTSNGSTDITVSPQPLNFIIGKSVKDRVYLTDAATVTIKVSNGGMFDAYNIDVNDSLNENFELKTNTPLYWHIPLLKAGAEWSQTYSIKPLETNLNGFVIPLASAQYTINNRPYNITSKTTTMIVNGPKIILNKSVDKAVVNISEEVKVSLNVINAGNIATHLEVNDSLPDGVSLISGQTYIPPAFLELNTPNQINYTIRMDREGQFQLPAAIANYTGIEYRGIMRSAVNSQRPVITVVDPSKIRPASVGTQNTTAGPENKTGTENTKGAENQRTEPVVTRTPQENMEKTSASAIAEPTSTPITPGFEIVLTISALILLARKK